MGTRGLTMVVYGGETKVAQYRQWDHYPSGNGVVCLEFLQKGILDKFKEKLNRCRFMNDDDFKVYEDFCKSIGVNDGWVNLDQSKLINEKYPYLTRDHGSHILEKICESDDTEILLHDQTEFAGDGLFCEYGYVIDLDKYSFEVYEGFGKKILSDDERFKPFEKENKEYKPIRLIKSYDLNNLPTVEEFLSELEPKNDDE